MLTESKGSKILQGRITSANLQYTNIKGKYLHLTVAYKNVKLEYYLKHETRKYVGTDLSRCLKILQK